MTPRIILLVTSPRLPAGVLTADAWDLVRAHPVFAVAGGAQVDAIAAAGASVTVGALDATGLISHAGEHGTVVWLTGPDGDPGLVRSLGLTLVRSPELAEMEVRYGSWDPPGARLLDVVTVMDRLLAPGGDPWKQAQTHQTLARFLLEEAYEAHDAMQVADTTALREELGDVLLQVVLHARLAEGLPDGDAWTIDDVAGDLVAKLIRRNPHVFAGERAGTLDEITANWERIKQEEKSRESVLDGVVFTAPALALADKVISRARGAGLNVDPPSPPTALPQDASGLGLALLGLVVKAQAAGLDAEGALRRTVLDLAETVRTAERAR